MEAPSSQPARELHSCKRGEGHATQEARRKQNTQKEQDTKGKGTQAISHEEAKCPVQQGRLSAFRKEERQEDQAKGVQAGVGTLALFCPREVLTGWWAEVFASTVAKGPGPRRASASSPESVVRTLPAYM